MSVKDKIRPGARTELRNCVKVEVDVLVDEVDVPNKPTVSVDVKQHFNRGLGQFPREVSRWR